MDEDTASSEAASEVTPEVTSVTSEWPETSEPSELAASPEGEAPLPPSAGWRTGRISFPAIVVLLIVLGAAGLGAASIGGWGSVAVLVILIVAALALITSWAVTS